MTRRFSYRFDLSTSVSRRFRWPACITISIWRMAMYDPVERKKADAVLYRVQEDGIEIIHGRIKFIGLVIKISH